MSLGREAIVALHEKYVTLVALHEARAARQDAGFDRFEGSEAEARKGAFQALARQFPGALRELEVVPLAELQRRRDALQRWIDGPPDQPVPRWAEAAALFHASLAIAISIRTAHARGVTTPGEDTRWTAPLGTHGRLLDRVWDEVARALGTTAREAELLVYPSAPARGTRTSERDD